jgi:hypothetical protein
MANTNLPSNIELSASVGGPYDGRLGLYRPVPFWEFRLTHFAVRK